MWDESDIKCYEALAKRPQGLRGPGRELERREATGTLYRVLDGMREKYRTVFILFEIEGLSGPEIAALTGLSAATLRVRLFRARAQFFEKLRAIGAASGPASTSGSGSAGNA